MKVENLEIPEKIKSDFLESGIIKLNPPQKKAVESGLLQGQDMIVASPTASGKTFIAELSIIEQVLKNDQKGVYIVPLKALATEKYQDFKERYPELDVRLSIGDLDDGGEGLETADLIIATSEKLDSLLRHNPSWVHEIGLVVIDEIHLLTSPNRGPTLEVTITRLRDLLEFQILGLSATISNSNQMAEWLDAELVESQYRPVNLKEGVFQENSIEFIPDELTLEEYKHGQEKDKEESSSFMTGNEIKDSDGVELEEVFVKDSYGRGTLNLLNDTLKKEKQCIIFTNSRKGAEKSSDRCSEVAEKDLSRQEKQELSEYAKQIENELGSPTKQCKRLARNVRKGAAYHHAGLLSRQRSLVEEAFKKGLIRSVSATPTLAAGINMPAYRVIMRDLKRYTGQGMDFIPTLEYEQMVGRAGRPKYDDSGEAISLAKNPGMEDEIIQRYILGESEKIQSKLAAEPILRMHTLSLIASKFTNTREELYTFFQKTFYAHQFGDFQGVKQKIDAVLNDLEEYGFLNQENFKATKIGKRVSELYLDPDSAHLMLKSLECAEGTENRPISYLFMLSRTTEMQPRPNVSDKEWGDIQQELADAETFLLESVPEEWDPDFDYFIECMKTAMMMQAWISELDEEKIMDRFGIAPGGIRAKMRNADWMIYASKELARMKDFDKDVQKDLEKLGIRLKHGIGEELLNLVQYDQIGRVRARKLYDYGVKDRQTIRKTDFEKLKKLIGESTARKLKKQVGQENIFDRENIMDYFD